LSLEQEWQTVTVRTGAWYGDGSLDLKFPAEWDIVTHWPRTPPRLSDEEIATALESPDGQPPIRELARGKSRPAIVVDDLTRPTPAARVIPAVLRQLEEAGISQDRVRIIIATGAHPNLSVDAIAKKVGDSAAEKCRVVVHDDMQNLVDVGRTSFGTSVLVDREVVESDLLIGIGGIYPQQTLRFGGGAKLALGVLGRRSIINLHYGHGAGQTPYQLDDSFRQDLAEIARMIGLETTISVHIDAAREIVLITSGDHRVYYKGAVQFARERFLAPTAQEADVVVANAYPIDLSLTFAHKSMEPLHHASPSATRVLVSACSEGIGLHKIFSYMAEGRLERLRRRARVSWYMPGIVPARALARLRRTGRRVLGAARGTDVESSTGEIWLYPPGHVRGSLPSKIPDLSPIYSWREVVDQISKEQSGNSLRVAVYPCAALQVLDLPPDYDPSRGGDIAAGD
jgi:nickel-dependent lactate racemase